MTAKKIISAIIILGFTLFSCAAQEKNKFETFQNRLKKGNSTLGLNINFVEYYETGNAFGCFASPSVEYSYFLANRFSINTTLCFKQSFFSSSMSNDHPFFSQKSIDLSFKYYFFKRGGFFIGLGGSFGHILVDAEDDFGRKFYAAPKINLGYSYMITNVWKQIDNKVSVNISISSYIPCKSKANFDVCDNELPYLGFFYTEIGVVYYFLRK